jgi:hypothetical protein
MKEVADMGQMRWLRFSCMWKKTAGWILYLQVSMIALKIPILKVDPIQILIQLPFLQWWIRSYKRDPSARELIEEGAIIPTQDIKFDDITYVNKEYEKRIIYMNQLCSMIMRIEDLILDYSTMIIITIYSFR